MAKIKEGHNEEKKIARLPVAESVRTFLGAKMTDEELSKDWNVEDRIPGAKKLVEWFGSWPTFHDAEVIEVHLSRGGDSWMQLHAWKMTNQVDEQGYYVHEKQMIATFHFSQVCDVELYGFNHQNVIFSLGICQIDEGIELTMVGSFGLEGRIVAESIALSFLPGGP